MERVGELLEKAIGLSGEARARYLDQACGGDSGLRHEVESLIAAHEQAGSRFLNEAPDAALAVAADGAPVRAGRRIGPYLLTAQIGQGGMGEVFAAVRADGQYEKTVALKLVRGGYASAFVLERFRTERQILAGLDHPNIARLLDGGTSEEGIPYLVMELVEGTPIDAYCEARRLPVAERLALFRRVCDAVQYAHRRLVIHRDIKPGNILVTQEGMPKLLDFGIAKILDPSGSTEATVLRPMTPEFASPEQVAGEPVTTATDVYSLGVVLYWLLVGCSPYGAGTGDSPARLSRAIGSLEPRRPSAAAHRNELRGDLDEILLKALRKEPDRRYGSVEQFSEDIRRHLEGLPVEARKGTWSYRAGKFLQRHRAGVAAAALLLATLMAGVVTTLHEARVAEASQRRAEARFNDVRKLANSLLFEINDALIDVPGATRGRQLILQRSLEYLDSLATESGNDPALLRELATAYSRIAVLQGNPSESNLGDVKAALASVQKALEMRQSLVRIDPQGRKDRLALATVYIDYADMQLNAAGNARQGFEYARKAAAMLEAEVAAAPDDPKILAQAVRGYKLLGSIQVGEGLIGRVGTVSGGVADLKRALALNQPRFRLTPADLDVPRKQALVDALLGDALFRLGDYVGAEGHYRGARDALQLLDPAGARSNLALNSAILTSKIGDALIEQHRDAEALSHYAKAAGAESRLYAAEPRNEVFHRSASTGLADFGVGLIMAGRTGEGLDRLHEALALLQTEPSRAPLVDTLRGIYHVWIGAGLEHLGRVGEASREYAAGRALFASLLAGEPGDQSMPVNLACAAERLAAARRKLGNFEAAAAGYREARTLLEPLLQASPEDQDALYALAETYAGEGMLAAARAERAAAPAERQAQWQAARERFRDSLQTWGRVSHPKRSITSGLEMTPLDEVSRRLARSERALAGAVASAR
jgi:non-specific serine/threonine protein kinase/serine/threonine-protein kinase